MSINANISTTGGELDANPAKKLCHIVKRTDFDGYGFNLHSEKSKPGQYVGKVDTNSPAELAGLKEGDRIIEVNGVAIGDETHKQVVQRIKAISCEVRLLLLSPSEDENGKDNLNSSNISSISMSSSKRISNGSQNTETKLSTDEADHVISTTNSNGHNQSTQIKPEVKTNSTQQIASGSSSLNSMNDNKNHGNLKLPGTAAEMRAKLLSKKKFDPKNENVDLKKKFEIVQKL